MSVVLVVRTHTLLLTTSVQIQSLAPLYPHTLGLDIEELERIDRLWITDAYSASLGQKSKERYAVGSLKVADLSIWVAREAMADSPAPEFLIIQDNVSTLDRFNAEKSWVEMYLTRPIPMSRQMTNLHGIIEGIHSDWAMKN